MDRTAPRASPSSLAPLPTPLPASSAEGITEGIKSGLGGAEIAGPVSGRLRPLGHKAQLSTSQQGSRTPPLTGPEPLQASGPSPTWSSLTGQWSVVTCVWGCALEWRVREEFRAKPGRGTLENFCLWAEGRAGQGENHRQDGGCPSRCSVEN